MNEACCLKFLNDPLSSDIGPRFFNWIPSDLFVVSKYAKKFGMHENSNWGKKLFPTRAPECEETYAHEH